MSIETRSSSAFFKRAEQLKRWEESDTNREPVSPKQKSRKINFSSGCVFLAACAAGEKDEVYRLLQKGADIDTANVDGLTALHQACIDDNLDMVEFLVENGADVNRGDNEGWTPLHATASCGFLSIAKYLIEHGADIAAVNHDGQLALDVVADSDNMRDFLESEIRKRGVDCEEARNEEERVMLRDAKDWLASKSALVDVAHPKTGATALHVAAAKGYTEVMKILLQCGADVDKQDIDGWTPLHAAAYWGQKEASKILAESLADMDIKNYGGQTAFDLAVLDSQDMCRFLEDLKKKQDREDVLNRRQAKKRTEVPVETETPIKLKKVELEIEGKENTHNDNIEKRNRANSLPVAEPVTVTIKDVEAPKVPPSIPQKRAPEVNSEEHTPAWRKMNSRPTVPDTPVKISGINTNRDKSKNEEEVTIKRTNSFKNDPEFYNRYLALHARIKASSAPHINSTPFSIIHSNPIIAYPDKVPTRRISNSSKPDVENTSNNKMVTTNATVAPVVNKSVPSPAASPVVNKSVLSPATSPVPNSQPSRLSNSGLKVTITAPSATTTTTVAATTTAASTPTTPTTPGGTRMAIFKNFFKSFVPPVRDEESETQRKAHAKRVRETRRSTQCVTIEEIKSAEQIVKNKTQPVVNNNNNEQLGANGESSNGVSVTATITTATPTVITREAEEPTVTHERRPSWRLKIDTGSKFKLEDASKSSEPPGTPSFVRRPGVQTNLASRPSSAPAETADTTVTLPLRRPKSQDDKEQDKENDARNAQASLATQAAIHRRRRTKRRSTGVVNFDNVDDQDPAAGGDCEESANLNHQESGNERPVRTRMGSTSDIPLRGENGEIDYKKLYEQTLVENDRLKDKLRKSEEELRDTKLTLERINVVTSKNSLSELEKRERRAMERKLSEMEEELKQLENLKTENQRLKDENGALIRVISKLSK